MTPPPTPSGSSLSDLLREARAAASAGDKSEAERLYRRVLDRSPANVEAWMGLGAALTDPEQKAGCFRKVLELDPENPDAAASLERLRAVLPTTEPEILRCAFHPNVETVLRCSQCGRPICVRCAQHYPVGQLCPVCVSGRRPLYYQAGLLQLLGVGGATLAASALVGFLATFIMRWGFILAILGGPFAGSLLAQLALVAGQRRRGPVVQITVGICIAVGSLAGAVLFSPYGLLTVFYNWAFLLFVALAIGSAVTWLR